MVPVKYARLHFPVRTQAHNCVEFVSPSSLFSLLHLRRNQEENEKFHEGDFLCVHTYDIIIMRFISMGVFSCFLHVSSLFLLPREVILCSLFGTSPSTRFGWTNFWYNFLVIILVTASLSSWSLQLVCERNKTKSVFSECVRHVYPLSCIVCVIFGR